MSATEFVPSRYQADFFDVFQNRREDIFLDAKAGSGKTTTLVRAASLYKGFGEAVFFAFNVHIKDEIARRIAGTGMTARTIHSYGMAQLTNALGRMVVARGERPKYRQWCVDHIDYTAEPYLRLAANRDPAAAEVLRARQRGLEKLVDFARLTLTDPNDHAALRLLIKQADILLDSPESEEAIITGVAPILERGMRAIVTDRSVDFTDMIWGPLALRVPLRKFGLVMTDEAQDLNAAQRTLVLGSRGPGGKQVFCGDENQAIMAFAGADAHSYREIQRATSARVMPLSICYRCPTRHIALARQIVPAIEAAPGAKAGEVRIIRDEQLPAMVQDGMLILCRMTAPLVSLCIKLIRMRIPARVRGRDIGKGLVDLVRLVGRKSMGIHDFPDALSEYEDQQLKALQSREGNDERIEAMQDRCEAVLGCWADFKPTSYDDFCRQITDIFSGDDERAPVMLSTIHRAKGLEAKVVAVLKCGMMPMKRERQTEDQYQQEKNLWYVALTRAMETLILCYEPGDPLPSESQVVRI